MVRLSTRHRYSVLAKRAFVLCLVLAALTCLKPTPSLAKERGNAEIARYSFSGKVSTASTRVGPYNLPNRSSLSYYNKTNLGGRKLYIRPFLSNGKAYTSGVSMTFTGTKYICGTSSGSLALYPHLWLNSGSLQMSGQFIIRSF